MGDSAYSGLLEINPLPNDAHNEKYAVRVQGGSHLTAASVC